jgi:hypothetical protein
MLVSKEGNLVTLINVFETTPKPQQALIDQWTRFTEVLLRGTVRSEVTRSSCAGSMQRAERMEQGSKRPLGI